MAGHDIQLTLMEEESIDIEEELEDLHERELKLQEELSELDREISEVEVSNCQTTNVPPLSADDERR